MQTLSPAEYLERERPAEFKNEYINGVLVDRQNVSPTHVEIMGNIGALLWHQCRDSPFHVMMADMRVCTPNQQLFAYPDVLVTQELKLLDEHQDTLLNPIVIIEVLSPATEHLDRFTKFNLYQTIPTLKEHILVHQEIMAIEHRSWLATEDKSGWTIQVLTEPDEELVLDSISCGVKLADIYEGIETKPIRPVEHL